MNLSRFRSSPRALWMAIGVIGVILIVAAGLSSTVSPVIVGAVAGLIGLSGWMSALHQRASSRHLNRQILDLTSDLAAARTRLQIEASQANRVLDAIGAILNSLADGVIVFDRADTAIITNPAATRLMGCPAPSVIGAQVEALLRAATPPAERDRVIQLVRDRTESAGLRIQLGNMVMHVSVAPVRLAPNQTVIGTVLVCHDLTREAELDRLKSIFVSMVSHDLRAPLVNILSNTDLLELGAHGQLADGQLHAVTRIATNTRLLLRLVNDLLDQAQIEAGKVLSLRPVTFSPADVLNEAVSAVIEFAQAKDLKLTTHLASDVPSILIGDPQRLLQILVNLVSNALKYTDQGSVHISITRFDASHWRIEVSDTGPGVPIEDQSHIFEPFRRAAGAGTQTGVGLGLAVVKHLVDLMEGEIRLSSQVGRGSIFTIILPLTGANADGARSELK